MAHRNFARLVAPLALGAAAVGVVVVIQASRPDSTGGGAGDRPAATATERQSPPRARTRVYVVKPGDTLTAIADEAGVSLETIERLNPNVEAQTLQTGQRLKLSP